MRLAILCLVLLSACGKATPAAPVASASGSTISAQDAVADPTAENPAYANSFDAKSPLLNAKKKKPVVRYLNGKLVEDTSEPVIVLNSEFENYRHGKLDVPAYPGDMLYLGVNVQTEAGSPLKNIAVKVSSKKGNTAVLLSDKTDDQGYLEFHVVANQLGEDLVTVEAAGVKQDFFVSVTQPPRSEWLGGLNLNGVTSWDLLMSSNLNISRDRVAAVFPPDLIALKDKTVRLVGFMLPLSINEQQAHFLLSANPPSCFFHPPGGPASAIEVFASKAVEMSYDPMIIEGKLELISDSADGILFKLRGAHLIAVAKS